MKTCADGNESTDLLVEYGKITKAALVKYVPHIIFNDVFNQTLEHKARGDFVGTVCSLLEKKPSGC